MKNSDATLSGELASWPDKDSLEKILTSGGLQLRSGRYSLRLENCGHFVFQNLGGDLGQPQVEASAETSDALIKNCLVVSKVLAAAEIKHRFEVYGADEKLAAYLHHQWPA